MPAPLSGEPSNVSWWDLRHFLLNIAARLVDIAVDTLPTRCKKIIKLSLLGYKNGEIANELEITLNTVKAQKKIAYRKLRFQLREHMAALAHIFLP